MADDRPVNAPKPKRRTSRPGATARSGRKPARKARGNVAGWRAQLADLVPLLADEASLQQIADVLAGIGHRKADKSTIYRWSRVPEVQAAVQEEIERRRRALPDAPLRYSRRMWDFFADVATGDEKIESEEQAAALAVFLGLDAIRRPKRFGGDHREPVGESLAPVGMIPAGTPIQINVGTPSAPQLPAIDYGRDMPSMAPHGDVEVLDD